MRFGGGIRVEIMGGIRGGIRGGINGEIWEFDHGVGFSGIQGAEWGWVLHSLGVG